MTIYSPDKSIKAIICKNDTDITLKECYILDPTLDPARRVESEILFLGPTLTPGPITTLVLSMMRDQFMLLNQSKRFLLYYFQMQELKE